MNNLRADHTLNRMIPANGMGLPTTQGGLWSLYTAQTKSLRRNNLCHLRSNAKKFIVWLYNYWLGANPVRCGTSCLPETAAF